ncbi:MAG: polyphosphate kinase [Bradymonadia bacterium]
MTNLKDPALYFNRETSWLRYNARVLANGLDESYPLLERLRFMSYFRTNLDEFFMIRVANLLELEAAQRTQVGADGLTPTEQLKMLAEMGHELDALLHDALLNQIMPQLAVEGVTIAPLAALSKTERKALELYFDDVVSPVLTPLTVDPSHPFPHLANLEHNIVISFTNPNDGGEQSSDTSGEVEALTYAIVEIPSILEPLVPVGDDTETGRFVWLADVIKHFVGRLFPGFVLAGAWQFRVTRDADLALREPEVEDMLLDIERELHSRTFRRAVRLEVDSEMPVVVKDELMSAIKVGERETFYNRGPFHIPALAKLDHLRQLKHLSEPPFNPRIHPRMSSSDSIFSIIREKDLLLHHPYESFSTVTDFLAEAARDPKVLAIKLTLYRTSGDSVIIDALRTAAANGKFVTAVVELKARFDEQNNIVWARELERAGCHVVYGIVGLKTHFKSTLVVRREGAVTRRYCHLSTGNYNSSTARVYEDIGFLTQDPAICRDVSTLFNVLTGYSSRNIEAVLDGKLPRPSFEKLAVSPFEMIGRLIGLIEDETRMHLEQGEGVITAKLNSLVDPGLIRALYRASQAGVTVRLVVRGICCLRPGVPGVSENIEVTSVVDRYLEHSRAFYFRHGGEELVFVSSADWMPRNLFRRVEAMFPVEDGELMARVRDEIIGGALEENVCCWVLQPDGTYAKPPASKKPVRSQLRYIELARRAGLKSIPYESAVRQPRERKKRSKSRKKSSNS